MCAAQFHLDNIQGTIAVHGFGAHIVWDCNALARSVSVSYTHLTLPTKA